MWQPPGIRFRHRHLHRTCGTVDENAYFLENMKFNGKWFCGDAKAGTMCLTQVHSGVLGTIMHKDKSTSEVVAVSEVFLTAWK